MVSSTQPIEPLTVVIFIIFILYDRRSTIHLKGKKVPHYIKRLTIPYTVISVGSFIRPKVNYIMIKRDILITVNKINGY